MRGEEGSGQWPATGAKALVLAVDDEAEVLALLEETLQELPIRLRCVGTAEEALRLIEGEVPAAIVSDQRLPGMAGTELLGRVRARWPGVPSLLFTGDAELRHGARKLAFPVLEKGARPEAVRAAVAGLLAGVPAVSEEADRWP